jgi:hypothetical protein
MALLRPARGFAAFFVRQAFVEDTSGVCARKGAHTACHKGAYKEADNGTLVDSDGDEVPEAVKRGGQWVRRAKM